MKTPKSDRVSQAPMIRIYKEIAPALAEMGMPHVLVACKTADTVKNRVESLKRIKALIAEYQKIYALLKPEVWQYYDNVLGKDAKDFREVKLRIAAKRAVTRALGSCSALKKAPKNGPADAKA